MPSRISDILTTLASGEDGNRSTYDIFAEIFEGLDQRLAVIENVSTSLAALQDLLVTSSQGIVDAALDPVLASIQSKADLGAILTASSVSEHTVGAGTKTFVLAPEASWPMFAPAHILSISAADDPLVHMYGRRVSYDPTTGTLVVDVIASAGAGTISSWTISPGSLATMANALSVAAAGSEITGPTLQTALSQIAAALNQRQPLAGNLSALAGLALVADRILGTSSDGAPAQFALSDYGKTLLATGSAEVLRSGIGAAPLNSPALTGTPTAPTANTGSDSNQIVNVTALRARLKALDSPVNDQDAATKGYVDAVAQGLSAKASVAAATTGNITLSGTQTVDGVALTAGKRVLVKNQTSAANNGIYVVATGAWQRAADANAWAELPGAFVYVDAGTVNGNTGWVCTSDPGGTIGTTAIAFTQFSGAGTYTAGAGLVLSGTQFSIGPHAHSVGDVTGLQAALDGKQAVSNPLVSLANGTGSALGGSVKADFREATGALFGGPSPEPAGAGVGMSNGDFNTVIIPGVYTIAGTWINGPPGTSGVAILDVRIRRYNNCYVQTLYTNDGQVWMRHTGSSGAASWTLPWYRTDLARQPHEYVLLSNDAVYSRAFTGNCIGWGMLTSQVAGGRAALFQFRAISTARVDILASINGTVTGISGNQTLVGTTGAAGAITIAANGNTIFFENRTGSNQQFVISLFGSAQ
ncbi:MAG: pyocin knob domain-containing protein [Rhizobium rosettiformans]